MHCHRPIDSTAMFKPCHLVCPNPPPPPPSPPPGPRRRRRAAAITARPFRCMPGAMLCCGACDLADQCHATPGQCHCHAGPVPLPRRAGSGARASAGRMGLGDRLCRGAAGGQLPWYTLPTSAPRLRSPCPHLHQDCAAHPAHIRPRTGLAAADWAGPSHVHERRGGGECRAGSRTREGFVCLCAAMHSHGSSPLRVSWADGFGAVRRPPKHTRRETRTARRGAPAARRSRARLRRLRGRACHAGRGKARGAPVGNDGRALASGRWCRLSLPRRASRLSWRLSFIRSF